MKKVSTAAITLKFPWEDGQNQDASPAALRIECRPMIILIATSPQISLIPSMFPLCR
jgi:hypothetical protein